MMSVGVNTDFHVGLPLFSISLSETNGTLSLSVSTCVPTTSRALPGSFQKKAIIGGANAALGSLLDVFPRIAGEFAADLSPEFGWDLASIVGDVGLRLLRSGRYIKILGENGQAREFGSESVVVLEVLLAFGNELARRATDRDLVRSWWQVSERSELLAMQENDWSAPMLLSQARREAAWYAARLGVSAEEFEKSAVWLWSRQILFATNNHQAEPTWGEYSGVSKVSPPRLDEVNRIAEQAAAIVGQTDEEFLIDSLANRSNAVRQEVVFKRWYGDGRSISSS